MAEGRFISEDVEIYPGIKRGNVSKLFGDETLWSVKKKTMLFQVRQSITFRHHSEVKTDNKIILLQIRKNYEEKSLEM